MQKDPPEKRKSQNDLTLKRNTTMKKEYLILIAIILILGAYLFLHKENKDNYTLPVTQKIETSQISKINLSSKNGSLEFKKKGDNWVINKEEYLASPSNIQNMIDTFTTFKLTALVSEKADKRRYELDDDHSVSVIVFKGDQSIFEFSMGKTAPTFNHTFVMLEDDKNIYHANGSFKSNFDKELDDFRDKNVLEFKKESILKFSIEKDGLSKTLIANNQPANNQTTKTAEPEKEESVKDEPEVSWSSIDGSMVDPKTIIDLLSSISSLECEKYSYEITKDQLDTQTPLSTISLENPEKMLLKIFKKGDDEQLVGISSMNDYAFELSSYGGQEIITKVEALLGIEKEDTEKKD
jgi:uncharacterized protein DUF4340